MKSKVRGSQYELRSRENKCVKMNRLISESITSIKV